MDGTSRAALSPDPQPGDGKRSAPQPTGTADLQAAFAPSWQGLPRDSFPSATGGTAPGVTPRNVLLRESTGSGRGSVPLRWHLVSQLQRVHGNRWTARVLGGTGIGPASRVRPDRAALATESATTRIDRTPAPTGSTTALIQRAPPTPDELRAQLQDQDALASFDQWRLATAPPAFQAMINGAGGKNAVNYDVTAASAFFKNKKMTPEQFEQKRAANEVKQTKSAREDIKSVKDSCDETDGTNRPGAAANPPAAHGHGAGTRPNGVTSEGALLWETEHGQPWMTTEGHYQKIHAYITALVNLISQLHSYKPYIRNQGLIGELDAAILRATQRSGAMRPALDGWNQRAAQFPAIWEATGKPKVAALISNSGTPVPDWPANPGPMTV